jgi:xanthine dehydrogenase accessory factor
MKEMRDILSAYKSLVSKEGTGVLATVVQTSGPTYRRRGARALILPGGRVVGHLGGCLSSVLLDAAQNVLRTGRIERYRFEKKNDADLVWMERAGAINLLLERVDGNNAGALDFIDACTNMRRTGVLATVIRTQNPESYPLGAKWMRHFGGEAETTDGWVPPSSLDAVAARVFDEGKIRLLSEGTTEILLERIAPPLRLLLFGDGAEPLPVAQFASGLGWSVELIGRGADRWPEACSSKPQHNGFRTEGVLTDSLTAALLMTHDYAEDARLLRFLLPSDVRYIGLLGPKQRTQKLLKSLQDEASVLGEDAIEKIHGPAGFDIGAQSPEAIALSIVSEIHAVVSGRRGGSLRDRAGSIHGERG